MNLLILELGHSAGTHTVSVSLIPKFLEIYEKVIFCGPNYRLKSKDFEEIPNQRFKRQLIPSPGARGFQLLSQKLTFAAFLFDFLKIKLQENAINRFCKIEQIDHIFIPWIFDTPPLRLKNRTGAMLMDYSWRHEGSNKNDHEIFHIEKRISKWFECVDFVFPISEFTKDQANHYTPGYSNKMCPVLHAADPKQMKPREGEGSNEYKLIYYPASLTFNKHHDILLESLLMLADDYPYLKVVFTGRDLESLDKPDAPATEWKRRTWKLYRQVKNKMGERIQCEGFVSRERQDSLYANAHLVVLSTTYEGFGLPLIEAFERGIPTVCFGIPPFKEQISRYSMETSVEVVEEISPDALTDCLKKKISESYFRIEPKTLQKQLDQWTWAHAASHYQALLKSNK